MSIATAYTLETHKPATEQLSSINPCLEQLRASRV